MRGVSKLVLELKPENEYFEKAILFLSPDKLNIPQKEISESAEKLLSDIKNVNNYRKTNNSVFLLFIGAASGSLVSWFIFFLISIMNT